MTQKQFIESKIEELRKLIRDESQSFIFDNANYDTGDRLVELFSTALKEIVEEHMKFLESNRFSEKILEQLKTSSEAYQSALIYNDSLDQITSRHNKFLS